MKAKKSASCHSSRRSRRSEKEAAGKTADLNDNDPAYYGAAIGGLIGTCVAGPVGTIIGAASGAAWGKAAQGMVKSRKDPK